MKNYPKGFDCSTCKKHHVFTAYVGAHWRERVGHTCDKCGARHTIVEGQAELIVPGKVAAPTREQLVAEFTELRNAQLKRPATGNTRLFNIYCDHLNDTDTLARVRTDEDLARDIERMKASQ